MRDVIYDRIRISPDRQAGLLAKSPDFMSLTALHRFLLLFFPSGKLVKMSRPKLAKSTKSNQPNDVSFLYPQLHRIGRPLNSIHSCIPSFDKDIGTRTSFELAFLSKETAIKRGIPREHSSRFKDSKFRIVNESVRPREKLTGEARLEARGGGATFVRRKADGKSFFSLPLPPSIPGNGRLINHVSADFARPPDRLIKPWQPFVI